MGDVLRSNAERLLHDIQTIHSRMVGDLDRVDPDAGSERVPAAEQEPEAEPEPGAADELQVPDFIPQR